MSDQPISKKVETTFKNLVLIERTLLRTLLEKPNFLEKSSLSEELFSCKKTKDLFLTIQELYDKNISPTKELIIVTYNQKDILEDRTEFINELYNQPVIDNIEDITPFIEHIKGFHRRINTIKNLEAAIDKIKEGELTEEVVNDAKEFINDAEQSISYGINKDVNTVYTLPEWTEEYLEKTKTRRSGRQYVFNHFIFDRLITDGPLPGDFGLITARSGSGKSALILNLANRLIDMDIPVMLFSLEMGAITTMDRLLALRLEIPYRDVATPSDSDIFDMVRSRIKAEEADLKSHTRFRFSENPSLSLNDIRKHIKKFQQEIGQSYCIVMIDLLSMVQDFTKSTSGQNSAFVMEVGVNKFSAICKELGVHGIGVVQLNRGADEKVNDLEDIKRLRPTINQIKNAKAFEERARWVIGTHREKHYVDQFLKELAPEDKAELDARGDIMEVMVLKQNNGLLGRCNALFNGEYFRIDPIEDTLDTTGEMNDD